MMDELDKEIEYMEDQAKYDNAEQSYIREIEDLQSLRIFVWSEGFEGFYDTGLYVASGNSKKEAARKLAKLQRCWTWNEHLRRMNFYKDEIVRLENGGKTIYSPGREIEMQKKNLENISNHSLEDYESMNDELEENLFNRLMSTKADEINIGDLAVYRESVG